MFKSASRSSPFLPMRRPRRRRFSALEGPFGINDAGELPGVIEEDQPDAAPVGDGAAAANRAGLMLPRPVAKSGAEESTADETVPPAFRRQRPARMRSELKEGSRFLPMLLLLAGLALGALAGHFLPRPEQKPVVAGAAVNVPPSAAALTKADENDLDAAYAARHERRYAEARQLFTALKQRHQGWGPLDIELGRTLLYENRPSEASFTLKAAANRGEKPAEANYLLGMLNKARGSYTGAEVNFAQAVSLDPTQPDYYFFWGECLRAEGKLLEAVAKFRSALLRNQNEAVISLYRAKLWLSGVEAERENEDGIRAEIDAALAQPHPPMEALIAAAARDLKAGDFVTAASHLARARRRASPEVFTYIMRDPFFTAAQTRPELAELFHAVSPEPSPEAGGAATTPAPAIPLNELGPVPAVGPVGTPVTGTPFP